MFTELTEEEKDKYSPEPWPHTPKTLVKFQDKYWYVKKLRSPEHRKSDYLGWLLGKNHANVAEVRVLTPEEINDIISLPTFSQEGATLNSDNTYLIRLGNSYSAAELLLKTNDEAIAHELVYSVWIRRRDAHAFNRVYIDDVPIFFDCSQTPFLGERNLSYIVSFFQHPPNDPGCAAAWRIVIREKPISTLDGRNNYVLQAGQFVHDIDMFRKNIAIAMEKILTFKVDDISEKISTAGYIDMELNERVDFLKTNQSTLKKDIELMESVLARPFQVWNWI